MSSEVLLSGAPAAGPTGVLQQVVNSPVSQANGSFGWSVAVSGDYAVVGAYRQTNTVSEEGKAYVYFRTGTVWSLQATLISPSPVASGNFGYSVAISGDYAIIGAPTETGSGVSQSGRAHIFLRSGASWALQTSLNSPNAELNGFFGTSVSISGAYAVVGAYNESGGTGRAYVYLGAGATWSLQSTRTSPTPQTNGGFGTSVSIDGDYLCVGAVNENRAYTYLRSGTVWLNQATLSVSGSTRFGWAVSINGSYAIVGADQDSLGGVPAAGRAYVYVRSGTTWGLQATLSSPNPENSGYFGSSVSINGAFVVVGAYAEDANGVLNSGRAYLFYRIGTSWSVIATLTSPSPNNQGYFGASVAVNGDYIFVGAYGEQQAGTAAGRAYIYK